MRKHSLRKIEEFAAVSSIGETTLYNIVLGKKTASGKTQKTSVDTLKKLAETLNVPMHELLYMLEPDGFGHDKLEAHIPVVQVPVQVAGLVGAGKTQFTASDTEVFVEEDFARGRDLVAFKVYGNSMEGGKTPIHDGDVVIVNQLDKSLVGSAVVARISDDGYVCKRPLLGEGGRLQQLVSTNLDYEDPQFRIIGAERVEEVVGRVIRIVHDAV